MTGHGEQIPDWFSYGVFRFTREQIIWAYSKYDHFYEDRWPPMPPKFITDEFDKHDKKWIKVIKQRSTYTDPAVKKTNVNRRAYFENPKIIIGEIEYRLKRTKTDGKLLKAQILGGITEYELLEPESQMALNYISLSDFRKRPSYYLFKKNKSYYYRKVAVKLRPFSLKIK